MIINNCDMKNGTNDNLQNQLQKLRNSVVPIRDL